jgi:plastocyanin
MKIKLRLIFILMLLVATHAHTAVNDVPDTKIVTVQMQDYGFQPAKITIEAGTTVEWVNVGKHVHTVTDDNARWDSGDITTGKKFSHRFDEKGTFKYVCVPHEEIGMTGTVVVK